MYLCETLEGKVQVPYLNWNGDKRKLNANWSDNDWNGKGRLLFVRNLISFKGATEGRLFVFFFHLRYDLIMPTTQNFPNFN